MKLRRWAAVLFLSLPLGMRAQDASKVVAMENAWNRAELQNDAAALQLLLADNFVMTTADGVLYNKDQILASVRDKSYKPDVLQSSDMETHASGNTSVVTGVYHEKGTDKGKSWERRGRFTDTWVWESNRWQCLASHFSVKPE